MRLASRRRSRSTKVYWVFAPLAWHLASASKSGPSTPLLHLGAIGQHHALGTRIIERCFERGGAQAWRGPLHHTPTELTPCLTPATHGCSLVWPVLCTYWAYLVDCASLRFGSLMIGRSVAVLGMACGRTEGAPTLAFGPAAVRRPSCALMRNNNDGLAL